MGYRGFASLSGIVLTAILTLAAGQKQPGSRQKPKPAVLEIHDLKITVDGRKINIDGTVSNTGERPIEKLVLSFHFFDSDHGPVTTLKLESADASIEPGGETEIHAAANEPARAVSVEITAADRNEKDLKVVKPGPYPIE